MCKTFYHFKANMRGIPVEVLFFVQLVLIEYVQCDSNVVVRGVPPKKREFYKFNEPFTCLDQSQTLDWYKVNDDYCDCSDGSDEPGTPACGCGFFYCENKHHEPLLIPSSRVNDEICDCCDGSDEENSDSMSCPNTCWELGKAAREVREERARLQKIGLQAHHESRALREERLAAHRARLLELEREVNDTQAQKAEAEARLQGMEAAEKEALEKHRTAFEEIRAAWQQRTDKRRGEKVFTTLDRDQDGRITLDEIMKQSVFDLDGNGEVTDEEARNYMKDAQSFDLDRFMEILWPHIKEFFPAILIQNKSVEAPPQSATSSETEVDEIEPREPEHDEETKRVVEMAMETRRVRQELTETALRLEEMRREVENLMQLDYGVDSAFFLLADSKECFDTDEAEYTYRLCPFREVTQRPRDPTASSQGEISLGRWARWADEHKVQLYEDGQGCWNGPNRNTKVTVECGAENKLTNVMEPSRCEYAMTFQSPAACVMEALQEKQQNQTSERTEHSQSQHLEL